MRHGQQQGSAPPDMVWLPETARAVVLVSHTGGRWTGSAVLELAERIGRARPRTLLVNSIRGAAGPDGAVCGADVPGFAEAMLGRCKVGDVAVRDPARSYLFIPAGIAPVPLRRLVTSAAFEHLVRAASRGGTMLLVARAAELEDLAARGLAERFGELFDGWVQLGEAPTALSAGPWPRLLARVEPTEPASADSGRATGFTRPTSTPAIIAPSGRDRKPTGRWEGAVRFVRQRGLDQRLAGVAVVFLTTIAAVWLAWQTLSPSPPRLPELSLPTGKAQPEAEVEVSPSGTPLETAPAAGEVAPGDVAPREDDAETATARGVELPYSVLVASYVRWEDAIARQRTLQDEDYLALVAPTVIGERVYYRVFAGAVEDRLRAGDLMRSLVERQVKERERAWDMRPVALAFAVGDFDSEEEAAEERDRLHDAGLPAYVLAVGGPGTVGYRVYSGAFESEAAATALDSMLTAAGRPSALQIRRGVSR